MSDYDGVLPVLKPAGFTSHDVVAKIRRIVRQKRIGHTGTLDPQVTGVLPLCLGRATRIVEYLQELPKQYEAVMTIGLSTDTEDMTGNITERIDPVSLEERDVRTAIDAFVGTIEQIPPMYSAVKVDGKRLYDLARQGLEVERKPRKANIYEIRILEMKLDQPHPDIRFTVTCSKGTYIRTLCADIGRALGYPSVMASLIRTSTGNFGLADCLDFGQIEQLHEQGRLQETLVATDRALPHFPAVYVADKPAWGAARGQKLALEHIASQFDLASAGLNEADSLIRLYSQDDRFIGIFRIKVEQGLLVPEKNFIGGENEL